MTFQESPLNSSSFQACESPEHSNTSMAQTLEAHSPGLARTIIMVPKGHFMHKPHLWLEPPLARTIFHGPKPVRAIEVLLY